MTDDQPTAAPAWRYARTLHAAISPERAFALFVDPAQTSAWLLPFSENDEGAQETTIEGQAPVKLEVLSIERPSRLHTRMTGGNLPGAADMIVAVEGEPAGAKISVTHLGFGDQEAWNVFGSSFSRGWDEAYGDLVLYLRTGVKYARHIDDRRASIAAWPCRREWGVEITEVFPGGFADQAGIRAGDVLIKLDRAGIYEVADIWTFTRVRQAGEMAEATYIRGGELLTGRGRISRFEDFGE
ncbi:MAG: SRPBCC domain-containing protein [Caulobacterales bacterium]